MLSELAVSQLGVIEDARIDLAPGLTVITGETGAGKTMLLNALKALMGERTEAALVRHGADQAQVQGLWELEPTDTALARAEQAGALIDAGQLLAVRTFTSKGRSRAVLGGTSVPAGVLAEVVNSLVTIHGQSDQLRLKSQAQQRDWLDQSGGHAGLLTAYQAAYNRWLQATAALEALDKTSQADRREADELRQALAGIERVDPQMGEEDQLPVTIERLANAEELTRGVEAAHGLLVSEQPENGGSVAGLDQAKRLLESLARHDPALAELGRRVGELAYLASDLATELAEYSSRLELDPAALEAAQTRRAQINTLLRQHGPSVAAVLEWASAAQARLDQLDTSPAKRQTLSKAAAQAADQLKQTAAGLSKARRQAAQQLSQAITTELAALGMDKAQFAVAFTPNQAPKPDGFEEIEFLFSAHPDLPARPIAKGASGGELSRLMLALELVLAEHGGTGTATLVFDEVDQGVAGRAAVQVGQRLARLAKHTQVVVVTHLPQVAAHGQVHLVVEKQGARAGIVQVEGAERQTEIARMLAGREESTSALAHALELLRHAGNGS